MSGVTTNGADDELELELLRLFEKRDRLLEELAESVSGQVDSGATSPATRLLAKAIVLRTTARAVRRLSKVVASAAGGTAAGVGLSKLSGS